MGSKIFISYRREDSAGYAGRVHDRLAREFGRDLLFLDVDAIPLGANFVSSLQEAVAECRVLLAVIGPNWLNAPDKNSRLDNPQDFVRIEIATALQRNIPVVPILLGGATVPAAEQLPHALRELSLRNALEVRHVSFHYDMDKLVQNLRVYLRKKNARSSSAERTHSFQPSPTTRRLPVWARISIGVAAVYGALSLLYFINYLITGNY